MTWVVDRAIQVNNRRTDWLQREIEKLFLDGLTEGYELARLEYGAVRDNPIQLYGFWRYRSGPRDDGPWSRVYHVMGRCAECCHMIEYIVVESKIMLPGLLESMARHMITALALTHAGLGDDHLPRVEM